MLIIKSNVYSMDFWMHNTVEYDNIKITRHGTRDEYVEVRNKIIRERKHYHTGDLKIEVPADITDYDDLREFYFDISFKIHLLLSFSHGHDVPINRFSVYEETEQGEILQYDETYNIWTGLPGASSLNIFRGLNQFINTAMPLILDPDYDARTNIIQVITQYNSAFNSKFLESKFHFYWLGLESMANSYYENSDVDLVLTRQEWTDLKPVIKQYLNDIDRIDAYTNLIDSISVLRRGTIKERINLMFNDPTYDLDDYNQEISFIYDNMRVPLFHGRKIDWNAAYDPSEKMYRLKRILEKLIFKTLNFYDNDMIYYAIKEEDLSAR